MRSGQPRYRNSLETGRAAGFRRKLLPPNEPLRIQHPAALSYESEGDLREAVENFRAYLEILREWDCRDRLQPVRVEEEKPAFGS
jgi:hypothetical protein